jgi:hypothetical protein
MDGRSRTGRAGVHAGTVNVAVMAFTDGDSNERIYVMKRGVSRVLPEDVS